MINGVINAITSTFNNLKNAIFSQLVFIKNEIVGAFAGLPGQIATLLGGIQSALNPFITSITSTFTNLFNNIYNVLTNTVVPFLQNGFNSVRSAIISIPGAVAGVINSIVSGIQTNLTNFFNFLSQLPGQIINTLGSWSAAIMNSISGLSTFFKSGLDSLMSIGSSMIKGAQDLASGFNSFTIGVNEQFTQLGNLGAGIVNSFGAAITKGFQDINAQFIQPLIKQISDLPGSVRQIIHPTGSITPEDARAQLNQMGAISLSAYVASNVAGVLAEFISFGQIDQIATAAIQTLDDVGMDVYATDLMTFDYETGVKPALTREVLRRYVPNIPGPGDLVNMVVKEAFVESLRTPAPQLFAQYMTEQGFSEFWSTTFWTAHWQPIDLDRIAEMFHRGIIDEADFIRRMIILDFRPDDTEIMKKLLFRLPNRIEARIMSRFGLLSDEQLTEIIKAEGVREDFVEPLRVMMQEFNLTTLFSRTETTAISAFENGLITQADAEKLFQQIKRPPKVIEADLELAKLKRTIEFKDQQVKAVIAALKKGIIDNSTAEKELQRLGLDPDVIGMAIAAATYALQFGVSDKTKKVAPKLTAAQLVKALDQGVLSSEEVLSTLQAKGYTTDEANILLTISAPSK